MIDGINYNHIENIQNFVNKLNRDESELNKIQTKVDKLSQSIKIESNPKELVALKECLTLLQNSIDTYSGDIQLLKKISKQGDEVVGKIEKILKKNIFTALDADRDLRDRAEATLEGVSEIYPNLDRLSEVAMQSEVQTNQDILLLTSIGKKEALVEKDYVDIGKILKRNPNILFEKPSGEESLFSQLMKTPHAHALFDHIMYVAGQELYAQKAKGMQEILQFAFSRKRYERCYAQDSDVTDHLKLKSAAFLAKCTVKGLKNKLEKFQSQRPNKFKAWQLMRMGTSHSLTHDYTNRDILRTHWLEAEAFTLKKAYQHSGTKTTISRELIETIHKKMAAEDEEIPNPGVTRDVLNKQVAAGSSWMNNMCGAPFLSARLDELVSWMNDEFIKCQEGEKDPLILAAQTYQRVVSLHPFENGNGRMARLMMDYVLARYDIPPIVMGKLERDILNITVFPLLPDSTRNPSEFYNNMLDRISESFDALNKELETLS